MNEYYCALALIVFLLATTTISRVAAIGKKQDKGSIGERIVAQKLFWLSRRKYRVINDVMLRTDYGTTQIDHIVVSIYGIFVIETKNYQGYITGNQYDVKWTETLYTRKYLFYNPIRQNYAHVKALEKKLKLPSKDFIPIVTFSDNCRIFVNSSKPVTSFKELPKVIRSYQQVKFEKKEMRRFVSIIKRGNITSPWKRKKHVRKIQTKLKREKRLVAKHICPKCGGKLIKTNGKNNTFLKCQNYSKCRYWTKEEQNEKRQNGKKKKGK